jgi:hypothetical protein
VLTTQMKSVGEVMAIGRAFKEAMQKARRGLETGRSGGIPVDCRLPSQPRGGARFAAQPRCRRQPMRMRTPFDVAMPNAFSVGSIHTDCE